MTVVAVLGAGGTTGAAMARILLRAGREDRACNRTRALAGDGAAVVVRERAETLLGAFAGAPGRGDDRFAPAPDA